MRDPETFLTELYVAADDLCKTLVPPRHGPGRPAALARGEVVALAVFGQWRRFGSEREFYRYADTRLRGAFPTLPSRPQLNRAIRRLQAVIAAVALALADGAGAAYEILDGTGVRVRNVKRRGRGWLAGLADVGKCSRLGWYHGVRLLLAVTRPGAVTGFGFGPASTHDRVLADTFLALRARPDPRLPSVGHPVAGVYLADAGFSGRARQARWAAADGAVVVCPPQPTAAHAWPRPWRRWLAGHRQLVETVTDRLLTAYRLDAERPHTLDGLQARLAAKVALHNFVLATNRAAGRPALAIAEVMGWD